jgi:hypothetical protein
MVAHPWETLITDLKRPSTEPSADPRHRLCFLFSLHLSKVIGNKWHSLMVQGSKAQWKVFFLPHTPPHTVIVNFYSSLQWYFVSQQACSRAVSPFHTRNCMVHIYHSVLSLFSLSSVYWRSFHMRAHKYPIPFSQLPEVYISLGICCSE